MRVLQPHLLPSLKRITLCGPILMGQSAARNSPATLRFSLAYTPLGTTATSTEGGVGDAKRRGQRTRTTSLTYRRDARAEGNAVFPSDNALRVQLENIEVCCVGSEAFINALSSSLIDGDIVSLRGDLRVSTASGIANGAQAASVIVDQKKVWTSQHAFRILSSQNEQGAMTPAQLRKAIYSSPVTQ